MAADVPALWHAPTTTNADRKQLLRLLVEQVRVEVLGTSERVQVQVAWAGGHHSEAEVVRPVGCLTQLSYYPQLTTRVRELAAAGYTPAQIADRLNAEGLRPPKRRDRFGAQGVRDLMRDLGVAVPGHPRPTTSARPEPPEWWLIDLAREIGMPEVAALAQWTAIRMRWPVLAEYLQAHPQVLDDEEGGKLVDEGLRELWTDPAVQMAIGYQGRRLSAELIRRCCGESSEDVDAPT